MAKSEAERRIDEALLLAIRWAGTEEAHHLTWVIDQMVRVLAADDYEHVVALARVGQDGPETYTWDEGVPP